MRRAVLAALIGLLAAAPAAAQQAADGEDAVAGVAGPQGPEEGETRRQPWLIPLHGQSLLMRATLMRPQGAGPFPLAVISHGSTQDSVRRAKYPMPEYGAAARWLLERGHAVLLPLRPGHGATGGPYLEDQGRCDSPDYRAAGLATADSIGSAIDHMIAQDFIRKSDVVVVGHSAGGFGALALASRNPPMLKAAISFAGGRGGRADGRPGQNCAPDRLVAASAAFGRTARIPTLWLYAENDSYFAPALASRMAAAYRAAGGRAEFHMLPPLQVDGHRLIQVKDAAPWGAIAGAFLAGSGGRYSTLQTSSNVKR